MQTPRLILVLLTVLACTLLACSGSSSDSNLPQDWERFTEGAFAGAIHKDWDETYVDAADLDDGGAELPDSVESALDAFIAAGNTEVFFVFLEETPPEEFVTNINILGCEAPEVIPIVSDPLKLAEYYKSVGLTATPNSRVGFRGKDFVMLKLEVASDLDTYQVYFDVDGCYLPATLTTRKGETQWVDPFGTFISYLEPDVTKLR